MSAVRENEQLAVRLDMDITEAERLSELLPRLPEDLRVRVHDQLWLSAALTEQRRRTPVNERVRFTARANKILALLDLKEEL